MKRLLALVMGLAVLAAGVGAAPTMAHDEDNGFTKRSLEGSFGFSARGDDAVEEIHVVVVGLFSFDGEGECSLSFTGNLGGETVGEGFTGTAEDCTYEVNSDGTGTVRFSIEGDELTLAFVLVDDAEEFHFIELGQNVLSGVAKRQ